MPGPVSSVRRTRVPSGFSTHREYVWIPAFLGFKRTIRRFELRHSLPCGDSSPRVFQPCAMWHCMNLVCGPEGRASAVLLRAGEAVKGTELARKRRLSARNDKELAKGPARLAMALEIDRTLDGTDACASGDTPLWMLTGTPVPAEQVRSGPRTGVAGQGGNGGAHPWRYWVAGDPTVSPYRAHTPRRSRS
ncbi:hypothetical protein LK06_005820 [Streptomyces pluripotens]|nr:hypothetical protein LK06_005820 [Streptomyces pluripotens]